MTTLYIAGPMTGLPDFNYPAFYAAEDQLQSVGYRTLNPARSAARHDAPRFALPTAGSEWSDYMRNGINQLIRADGIALLPGWEDSRGARVELCLAYDLAMQVRDLTEWLANAKVAAS